FIRLSGANVRFSGVHLPDWIEILQAPSPPEIVSAAKLDPGETAAIALCLSQRADALLIDETLGRNVAGQLGMIVIGILGVLLQAHTNGLILQIAPVLDRLEQEAGFWIAP